MKRTWPAGVWVRVTRERRAITHDRGGRKGWGRARGARGRERLRRSCGEVCRGSGPATVTLGGRGGSSIVGAGVATSRGITSAITLVPAVRTAATPLTHFLFPCLKHRAVSVMCGKLGIEQGNTFVNVAGYQRRLWSVEPQLQQRPLYCIYPWRWASSVRRGVHKDRFYIDHVVCHGADSCVIFVIKGP